MTQRLTQERLAYIRDDVNVTHDGDHTYFARELLAEIDRLRAELAGAEERGRQRERADVVAFCDSNKAWGVIGKVERGHQDTATATKQLAAYFQAGDHVRTGITPPDAGNGSP